MRKQIIPIVLVLALILALPAQAISTRAANGYPTLSFDGTKASCTASIKGASSKDSISVTLTLYQGSTKIDSWTASGTYSVYISDSCTVQKGKSYTLKLTYSINGVSQSATSVTKTCPR